MNIPANEVNHTILRSANEQAQVFVARTPWYFKFVVFVLKYWRLFTCGFIKRTDPVFDGAITDAERKMLMRELDKEGHLLELKRRIIYKRNFLTKIQQAHCITKIRLDVSYRSASGEPDEFMTDFRGEELALLIPVMNLPGLKIQSTHPEDR